MEKINLSASVRAQTGKSASSHLRKKGLIPAVVYKGGKKTIHVEVSVKELEGVLHTDAGENVIINLKISGEGKKPDKTVIIKDIQHDPVKDDFLHVDFNEILLTEKIEVKVPVEVKGEAVGVKDGGVLEHVLWELEVECLPMDIPEKIVFDITPLKIGDTVYVKDLSVPLTVKVLNDPENPVVSVATPQEEAVEEAPAEGGEATEPDVIKQKKEEESAEGETPVPKQEKQDKQDKKGKSE